MGTRDFFATISSPALLQHPAREKTSSRRTVQRPPGNLPLPCSLAIPESKTETLFRSNFVANVQFHPKPQFCDVACEGSQPVNRAKAGKIRPTGYHPDIMRILFKDIPVNRTERRTDCTTRPSLFSLINGLILSGFLRGIDAYSLNSLHKSIRFALLSVVYLSPSRYPLTIIKGGLHGEKTPFPAAFARSSLSCFFPFPPPARG